MIQNLIGTLVNVADTVMLGYVSQTAMSASSLANQYTFILFCLYYGMATGTSVLCAQYWGKGDKKTVEKIYKQSGYDCCRQRVFEGDLIFLYVYGILSGFYECPSKYRKNNAAFCYIHCIALCQCIL